MSDFPPHPVSTGRGAPAGQEVSVSLPRAVGAGSWPGLSLRGSPCRGQPGTALAAVTPGLRLVLGAPGVRG